MVTPAADEEGMGPMEKGRHRYAKGDYAGALAAFTEVCFSQSSSSVAPLLFQIEVAITIESFFTSLARSSQSNPV
jgi:hypothetical protein